MNIFNRGQNIAFTHTFYDSCGDIAQPSSATLIVSYPSEGWPLRGLTTSSTISMTLSTVSESTDPLYLTWSATWASGAAYPGPVHWHIRASDLTLAVEEGQITLRGNPANMTITTTSTST